MPSTITVYVFLVSFGIGSSAPSSINLLIRGRYFGRKAFGSIMGISSLLVAPVGIIAPIYAGWVYDTTGSYRTAFILFASLSALAAIIVSFMRPPKAPLEVADASKLA